MGKSSSGPWAEEAAQIAKAQLANSSSGLVEEKKPQPALVKPSDPGQRPVPQDPAQDKARRDPICSSSSSSSGVLEVAFFLLLLEVPLLLALVPLLRGCSCCSQRDVGALCNEGCGRSSEAQAEPQAPFEAPRGGLEPRGPQELPVWRGAAAGGDPEQAGEPVRPGDDPFDASPASVTASKGTTARGDSQSGGTLCTTGRAAAATERRSGGGRRRRIPLRRPLFRDYVPAGRSFSALVSSFGAAAAAPHGLGGFRRGGFSTSNCSTEADANPFTKRGSPCAATTTSDCAKGRGAEAPPLSPSPRSSENKQRASSLFLSPPGHGSEGTTPPWSTRAVAQEPCICIQRAIVFNGL